MKKWLRWGWVLWMVVGVAKAATPTPESIISSTADDVIQAVKTDKDLQTGDKSKSYALIRSKVIPHFDFVRMTRLAVGKNWRQASPEQQQKLSDGFRDLLVRTYATSLSQYKGQTLKMKGTEFDNQDGEALVHSEVVPVGGPSIPIDYRMAHESDDWKVFDIQVDGVSLVTNYRGEFSEIVRSRGIDGLIQAMDEKSRKAANR